MDYEQWAEWYDVYYSTAPRSETDFYVELARESGGPTLEIGVGTGRVAIPAAKAGVDVTGVDLHKPMLERAARKARAAGLPDGKPELLQADMRYLDLGRRFRTVMIPANTLLLATSQEDQLRALRRAAAHLAPEGRLAFDVFVPGPDLLADDERTPFIWGETVHPETGNRVVMSAVNNTDGATQLNRETQIFEEFDHNGSLCRRAELPIALRYLFPAECHALIEEAGLVAEKVYGGFDRSPLAGESEEHIYVCRLSDRPAA